MAKRFFHDVFPGGKEAPFSFQRSFLMMMFAKRIAMAAFLSLVMGAPAVAQFEWHPDHVLPPGLPNPNMPWDGRRRPPAGGGGNATYLDDPVETQFSLVNASPWRVGYRINGHTKPVLNPGQSATWHFNGDTSNYPRMHISIDTGNPGRRWAEYDLNDGHTYRFVLKKNGIDLSD